MTDFGRAVRQLQLPGIDPGSLGPEIKVGSKDILFDREGALWVTSVGDGIRRVPYTDRFRGKKIAQFSTDAEIFTEEQGLSGNYIWTVFEDREGNIWIGTAKGLDRFRASDFVPIRFPPGSQNFGLAAGDQGEIWTISTNKDMNRIRDGIPTPTGPGAPANFIFRDEEGSIWMSTSGGVYRWKSNKFVKLPLPFGLNVIGDSEILKDRGGVLWVYTNQLGLCRFIDGIWSRYDRQAELPNASPITGALDSSDRKWFGFAGNKLTVIDGTGNRTFSRDDGLAVGDVKVIEERNGNVWVGGSLGVAVYEKDRFRMLAPEGAEALNGVSGIVETRDGALWLNASRGVIHIPANEVRLALENPAYKVRYRVFDSLDGVPGSGQQQGPFPTAVEGSDGRLWFSTG
jgi:ligand-binding sensor domain-containing protein